MSKAVMTLNLWDDRAPVTALTKPDLQVSTGDEGQFEIAPAGQDRIVISSEQARHLSRFLAQHAKADES